MPFSAVANPQGGQVVAGSAVITETGPQVDIHQSSQRAIIDWRSFDIAPNETTRFHQPNASSHTLNRVNSMSRSTIEGTIQANGNITIINPNGVFFSRGSTVDVGGLTATSADVRNDDFMAGNHAHTIAGHADAEIRNEGHITVRDTGLATLVAPSVVNDGVITAKLGKVNLASGETFVMDLGGDGQLQVAASSATMQRQLVQNSGQISADGGYVALTAAGARDVVDSLITNTGVIEARSIGNQQGKVVLYGEGSNAVAGNDAALKGVKQGASTVVQAGTIDVSGKNAGERGGSVEILGDQIALANGSKIDASGHTGATGTTDGKAVSAVRSGAAGGDIKIGGDYQGQGTTATAKKVYVDAGATITNDALATGDAGRTIVWSDGNTQFAGKVSATAVDGKGGFTEVSGKHALGFSGQVDLRSANGNRGTLLLDPTDITISNAADSADMTWDGTQFSDQMNTLSNLNTTTLTTQLGLSDVLVSTISLQAGSGTIDVIDGINWNSGHSLTLLSDSDITVRSSIINSGSGAITLTANAGEIYLRNASTIDAGGGLLTLNSAGSIYYQSTNLNALSGTGVTINGNNAFLNFSGAYRTINAKTGTLTLNGTTDANVLANLNLIADGFAIGGDVSTVNRLYVNAYSTTTKSMGLAGEVGDVQLDAASLNHLNPGQRVYIGSDSLGNTYQQSMRVGNYNWGSRDVTLTAHGGMGTLNIMGAQTAKHLRLHAGAFNINSTLSTSAVGTGVLSFSGINWMSLGGAAGTTNIDSGELDRIVAGWGTVDFGAQYASDIFLWEYNNWRSPTTFTNTGNLYVLGNQTSQAAGASFTMDTRGNNNNINISADINFLNGNNVIIAAPSGTGNTVTLGGNLTAGNALTIRRATTLSGAAGTTRTLTAGLGAFTLAATGSINAQDKNLEIITNNLTLTGAMNGLAGIKLSPYSSWYTIGVGDNSGGHDVNYSTALINNLKTNFANYTFGRSVTGSITNYMGAWDDPVTFLSANNFTTATAITADDAVTVNVGDDATINHAITATNGPIDIRVGSDGNGNIFINNGVGIDAGTGSLTLRAENGRIDVDAVSASPVTFTGTGLNITAQYLNFLSPGAYAAERFVLNSKTGNLQLNALTTMQGAGDYRQNLALIGDNISIGDNLWFQGTGELAINTYTAGRQISLGGATGGLELSDAELDYIIFSYGSGDKQLTFGTSDFQIYTATPTRTSGDIVMDGYSWANGQNYLNLYTTGQIRIDGAQDLGSTYAALFRGDMDVNAAITGGNLAFFYGKQGALLDTGGAAGTTMFDSDELDYIGVANKYFSLEEASGLTMQAYSNWRGNNNFGYGTTGTKTLTVAGAQATTGSSNLYFGAGGTDNQNLTIHVTGDIDTSSGAGELYFHRASTSNMNLGANLRSGAGGITIDRAVTLTGAAGTTRMVNAGTGALTLHHNGTTTTGGIAATDKNLEIIADSLSINDGAQLTATTGGILLSPYSGAYSIGVGSGGAQDLIYSTALINNLKTNFAHYTFGRASTGAIHNYTSAWDDAVTFLSGGNFTSHTAIAADDGVTITAGGITLDHGITSTNGPVSLHANAGDLNINHVNIDAGAGALSLRSTGGTIIVDANSTTPVTLTGTGLTTTGALAFADPGAAANETFVLNSKTGTLTLNNTATVRGNGNYGQTLQLIGDQIDILDTLSLQGSGALNIAAYTAGRQISLGGSTGGLELSAAELGRIQFANTGWTQVLNFGLNQGVRSTGTIDVASPVWTNGMDDINFYTSGAGKTVFSGAQNFQSKNVNVYGDVDIANTLGFLSTIGFYGKAGESFTIGGTGSIITSNELNNIQNTVTNLAFFGDEVTDIAVNANSNWRQTFVHFVGSGTKTVNVNGAQSVAGFGTGLNFGSWLGGANYTYNINADIDTRSSWGTLNFGNSSTHAVNVDANILAGSMTLGRTMNITGAAGTTRTLSASTAGTGLFLINNNAFTTFGAINATDKNLNIVSDQITLGGAVSSTTGNLTFSTATNGQAIGIGTSGAAYNIDDIELSRINAGTGLLTLGSSTHTGTYVINTAHAFDEDVRLMTGDTGRMTLTRRLDGHKDITFDNGTGSLYVVADRIVATDGGDITVGNIDGDSGVESITMQATAGAIHMNGVIGGANGIRDVNLTSRDAMTLRQINGRSLFARTTGATSDITLTDVLTLSGANTALELVSGDDIINSHGAGVFNLVGTGRFVTWSDDPLEDTGEEHFSGAATKRYNRNYGDTVEATGNIRNYSVNPTLTLTADATQYTYGDAAVTPSTYTLTGWHMAEDEAVHSMGGTFDFVDGYTQGDNAGTTYSLSDNGSTLSSVMGYDISYATPATLMVDKADLRVKAVDMHYTAGSGVPTVNFVFEATDFKMGENATTAGLIGAPVVSNINWNTVGAGTYAMHVGFGGLSSVNYNFSQMTPRGVLTVTGAGAPPAPSIPNLLPDTVRKVMNNAGILFAGTSTNATSGTNDSGSTNSGKRRGADTNAGSVSQNVTIYDAANGQMVTSMLGTISIDPLVMQAFGLTYSPSETQTQ